MKKFIIVLFCIVLTLCIYFVFYYMNSDRIEVYLSSCVDGDTAWFLIDGKKVKVRFLGIDAPEIAHDDEEAELYGEEASNYTCNSLKKAKHIYLEYDRNSDRYDKYQRMLSWVFVDDDNLNELLVRQGYASVKYVYKDYIYIDNLCEAQIGAYQEKLGIWSTGKDYFNNYCNKR